MKEEIFTFLATCFNHNGSLTFDPKKKLKKIINESKVPASPGIYFISYQQTILYIGKAGTVNQNGDFKTQKLKQRLSAKQDHMSRELYFRKGMLEKKIPSIDIYWFVTIDDDQKFLPAYIELKAIQMFYEKFNCLPEWNKCV